MSRSQAPELSPGEVFAGRYQVVRRLGGGAQGKVYEVVGEGGLRAALKVLDPVVALDDSLRARFRLEVLAQGIDSRYFPRIFDAGIDATTRAPYLVMELLAGEDVGTLLARQKRLAPEDALRLLAELARALTVLHGAGFVHRDLKPENLFLDASVRPSALKILDFGVAKAIVPNGKTPAETAALGTPLYMAPEALRGDGRIGPAADLYSTGQLAYVLLTGGAYWLDGPRGGGSLTQLLPELVRGPVEPASIRAARRSVALPPGFEVWFARATAAQPEARFPNAIAQVSELARVLGKRPDELSLLAPRSEPARRVRWPLAVGAAVFATIITAGALGLVLRASTKPQPNTQSAATPESEERQSPSPTAPTTSTTARRAPIRPRTSVPETSPSESIVDCEDVPSGPESRFRGLTCADILARGRAHGWRSLHSSVGPGWELTMDHADRGRTDQVMVLFVPRASQFGHQKQALVLRDANQNTLLISALKNSPPTAAAEFAKTLEPFPEP
ncbi:MAG: serine/threonine-protein kinase [Polyangiaceae bacterium]